MLGKRCSAITNGSVLPDQNNRRLVPLTQRMSPSTGGCRRLGRNDTSGLRSI